MKAHTDLIGKTVGILGYTEEGMIYTKALRAEGIHVVIGLREIDSMWPQAEKDYFQVQNLWNAVKRKHPNAMNRNDRSSTATTFV